MDTSFLRTPEMLALRDATRAAQAASGEKVTTRAKQGKFQVVHVLYMAGGKSLVSEMSPWLPIEDATRFLRGLC